MKRNDSAKDKITKSILGEIFRAKASNKLAETKLESKEPSLKPSDLSHDAGGAYNANRSFLQR